MNTSADIVNTIRSMKPQLMDKFHIQSIGVFGSVLRPDFNINSDIDIIVDFAMPIGIEFIDLANTLEFSIGRKVDVVSRKGMKPKFYAEIEKDILYV